MLEVQYPPRKDHLVTAKMIDIYQMSAETQLTLMQEYANSKPMTDPQVAYELKLRINLQKAWVEEIKKIRKEYFKKLHALAMMYMDRELLVFSYGIIKGESVKKISQKTNFPEDVVEKMLERFAKDLDSISLME